MSIYPAPPASARTVSGGSIVGDVVTASTTTVSITRTIQPIFVSGSAGRLIWTVQITADSSITDAEFSISGGTARAAVTRTATPASAVLQVPAGDDTITLSIVVHCDNGDEITIEEAWEQAETTALPVLLADPEFGIPSANGVLVPPPSLGLPPSEADSPARRSPQVRAAQAKGSTRPDLLPRANSAV